MFEEKNVNEDPIAGAEFSRRNLQAVPAFLIGDEVVVGLDKKKIEKLLDYTVSNCENCNVRMRIPKNKGKIRVTCPNCSSKFIKST